MKKIISSIKNNKKRYIIFFSITIISILMIVGFSYAYYGLNIDATQVTDVDVIVGNLEQFTFASGDALTVTSSDIGQSGTTHPSATLISGADGHTIDSTYDVYFDIDTNTFEYTRDGTPLAEVLLKVINPSGVEITEIDGLTYKTVEGNSGFDITGITGFFPLAINYPISTSSSTVGTTQEWDLTVTHVDLSIDQSHNANKELTGTFILKNGYIETLNNLILEHNGGKEVIEAKPVPDFSYSSGTNEGMFAAADDYGTSYYYRGAVDNNWLSFAGFYWRVVRINGDGSVKLIYAGSTAPLEADKVYSTVSLSAFSGQYNATSSMAEETGYMYQIGQQHGITSNSNAKILLDSWYFDNIYDKGYHSYISDVIYCNDRTSYTDTTGTTLASGTGTAEQYFGTAVRLINYNPSFICPVIEDSFTVSDTTNGNGALSYPVGLLTADEFMFAGSIPGYGNYYHYLSSATNSVASMSPISFEYHGTNGYNKFAGHQYRLSYYSNTIYNRGSMEIYRVNEVVNYRPVLSITADALAAGSGTWNDPYIVL